MFKHILIALLIFFSMPVFLVQAQDSNRTPGETLQLQELACNAHDPASLKACIIEARQIGTPIIKIVAPINCTKREDCSFDFSGIKKTVYIKASKPENKILRINDYNYTLFTINNASNLQFSDFTVEDSNSTPCGLGLICPPVWTVNNSNNITIDNLTFKKTHGPSVTIASSGNVTITRSNFINSLKTGIEITSRTFSEGLSITNNTFEGNAGSGIILQAQALQSKPSNISSNKFINNHAKGAYATGMVVGGAASCSYPCTGSQLRVVGPTSNLSISKNSIIGGPDTVFDAVGLYASGIEIGNKYLANVTLYCNEISQNRGSGIVQSPPFQGLSGINISSNKIWGNGLNLNIPVAKIEDDNCYTKECKLACLNQT